MEKGERFTLLAGMQTGAATVESSMEFPQNGTVFWPNKPTPGNLSKETWNTNLKEYMHPYVHCSIIYNSQDLETTQLPIIRWVDKKAVVPFLHSILHSGILQGVK